MLLTYGCTPRVCVQRGGRAGGPGGAGLRLDRQRVHAAADRLRLGEQRLVRALA
jgi:hypothetical protein